MTDRRPLVDQVCGQLRRAGAVAVVGPTGYGKSAVLDAVCTAWQQAGDPVVRLSSAPADAHIAYAPLVDLFTACPADVAGTLTDHQRSAVDWVLRRTTGPEPDATTLRVTVLSCLQAWGRQARPLLAADEVHWWGPDSLDVFGFAARRSRGSVTLLAALRPDGPAAHDVLGGGAVEIGIPTLSPQETAALAHSLGIPLRTAGRIHTATGGHPRLVSDLTTALARTRPPRTRSHDPGTQDTGPLGVGPLEVGPLAPYARKTIRTWLADLPQPARHVLLLAALAATPTLDTLRRAAGPAADAALATAEAAGLIRLTDGTVHFPAPLLRDGVAAEAGEEAVRRAHHALAAASPEPDDRTWHQASAFAPPAPHPLLPAPHPLLPALTAAAATARTRGHHTRAAELTLLAATHAEHTQAGPPAPTCQAAPQPGPPAASGLPAAERANGSPDVPARGRELGVPGGGRAAVVRPGPVAAGDGRGGAGGPVGCVGVVGPDVAFAAGGWCDVPSCAGELDEPAEEAAALPTRDGESGPPAAGGLGECGRAVAPGRCGGECAGVGAGGGEPGAAELLVLAAQDAAVAGRLDLAWAALERLGRVRFFPSPAVRAARVRARLAVLDAAGRGAALVQEVAVQALVDAVATGDPVLVSAAHLWLARGVHLQRGGHPEALAHARDALRWARRSGDPAAVAAAVTLTARIEQGRGRPEHTATLAAAPTTSPHGARLAEDPRRLAVCFALLDDRPAEAARLLDGLRPLVARGGPADELWLLDGRVQIHVLAGEGRQAREAAGRMLALARETGASPGPPFLAAAAAELAGGSLEQALGYAALGLTASQQEGDPLFAAHCLHLSGRTRLLLRDTAGALADLLRVRDLVRGLAVADPAAVRFDADLAEALVAAGDLGAATRTLAAARRRARESGRRGVLAALDRAGALCHAAAGAFEPAEELLLRALGTFDDLGYPLERGRVLLAHAAVERRRRRPARARELQAEAEAVFARAGAPLWGPGWREQAGEPSWLAGLTDAEKGVAELVADGYGNRDIAAARYVSVKTVEAVLTRIYRKLGVRSRVQLVALARRDERHQKQ